jgi:uncharacterized protein
MVIGTARVVLHIHGAQSLKDKRQVMKSVISQIQRLFAVSIAEIDSRDRWQVGVIGMAYVSTSAAHADEVIAKAVNAMESISRDAELLEFNTETVHVL